ncbi:MFS transporter [Actinocorallia longicatena]|uniref:MFS transporter n=2 Tax=Actinocorallia longicatena TaxID=111803 RepID=A0ABP6QKS2_9ACTN
MVIIAIAQLMVVLDATIVNIALPSAQADLGFSDGDRQWIVTGYALAFGSLLLLGGRIADLFGRKPVFIAGLVGFAVASALGGAAGSFEVLVAARVLQGVFGAMLAPAALSLLTTTFTEPAERARAFGIFGAVAGSGGGIGLLLGGALTEYTTWRWCLYVNLAFAAVAAVGGSVFLKHERRAERARLDLPGSLTVSAGLFGIVYGLSRAETAGWDSAATLGWIGAGAVMLAVFVLIQRRTAHPLLPLRVVLDRNRGASFLGVLFLGAGMFAVFLFLTYYLQLTLGYSPVRTGFAFMPMVLSIMVGAQLSTQVLMPKAGPRALVGTGMLLGAAGMLWLTRIDVTSAYATGILGPLMALGLGLGLVIGTSMSLATLGVRADDSGVASALVNTTQQIGGSIGTALLSTIATSAITDHLGGRTPTPALQAEAMVHSYTTVFAWAAGIFLLGALVCAPLMRRGIPDTQPLHGEPVLVH